MVIWRKSAMCWFLGSLTARVVCITKTPLQLTRPLTILHLQNLDLFAVFIIGEGFFVIVFPEFSANRSSKISFRMNLGWLLQCLICACIITCTSHWVRRCRKNAWIRAASSDRFWMNKGPCQPVLNVDPLWSQSRPETGCHFSPDSECKIPSNPYLPISRWCSILNLRVDSRGLIRRWGWVNHPEHIRGSNRLRWYEDLAQAVLKRRQHGVWMHGVWMCWWMHLFNMVFTYDGHSMSRFLHSVGLNSRVAVRILSDCSGNFAPICEIRSSFGYLVDYVNPVEYY